MGKNLFAERLILALQKMCFENKCFLKRSGLGTFLKLQDLGAFNDHDERLARED